MLPSGLNDMANSVKRLSQVPIMLDTGCKSGGVKQMGSTEDGRVGGGIASDDVSNVIIIKSCDILAAGVCSTEENP